MKSLRPFAMIFLLASACQRTDEPSLGSQVQMACSNLRDQLRDAANAYREFAGSMADKRLTGEQQARAEAMLWYGETDRARAAGMHGLVPMLQLCARSRQITDARSEALIVQISDLASRFILNPDPGEMARTVEGFAILAAELHALPLRD